MDPFVLGRDEMLAFFEGQGRETWEGWPTYEPKELIDAGDVVVRPDPYECAGEVERGRGRRARLERVDVPDGRPVEFKYFGEDRAAALEAAGLPE
jgi:hypothetical protein